LPQPFPKRHHHSGIYANGWRILARVASRKSSPSTARATS
jgi:hypothetical protein